MQELEQAARLALEALEDAHYTIEHLQDCNKRKIAMKALQDALKKSKQTKDNMTKQKFNKDNSSFSVTLEGKYPTHSVGGTPSDFYVYIAGKREDSSEWITGNSSAYHKLQQLHKDRNLMGFVEALEEIWERNV